MHFSISYHQMVTRQFTDKPTRSQSSQELVTSWTSQVAKMFYGKIEYIVTINVIC